MIQAGRRIGGRRAWQNRCRWTFANVYLAVLEAAFQAGRLARDLGQCGKRKPLANA